MFKKFATAAILAIASSSAFAAQPGTFYVGADLGKTKIDDVSGRATSAGAFIGYNFHQNFAIEAGYRRLGDYTFRGFGYSADVDLNQAALSVVGKLPVGNGFDVYGRLGYNRVEAEANAYGVNADESVSKALVGVGVGYAFTPAISARVELQKPTKDATNLSVGVSFQF